MYFYFIPFLTGFISCACTSLVTVTRPTQNSTVPADSSREKNTASLKMFSTAHHSLAVRGFTVMSKIVEALSNRRHQMSGFLKSTLVLLKMSLSCPLTVSPPLDIIQIRLSLTPCSGGCCPDVGYHHADTSSRPLGHNTGGNWATCGM